MKWEESKRKLLISLGVSILAILLSMVVVGLSAYLVIFIVGALFTFFITLAKPSVLFTVIFPFTVIFSQLPISVGDMQVSLERVLIIIGGIGLIGGVLVTKRLIIYPIQPWSMVGLILWIGFYFISLQLYPSRDGFILVLGYIQKIFLAYFVYISVKDMNQINKILKIYLLSSFIASIFTLFVYFQEGSLTYIRLSSFSADEDISLLRGLARHGTSNYLALWISMYFREQSSKLRRIFWTILVLWFGGMALFALRRESLITIPLGLVILIYLQPKERRAQTILLSLIMIGISVSFIYLSEEWKNRLLIETFEQYNRGFTRLLLFFSFTPAALVDSPLVGHGPANYVKTVLRFPETVNDYILIQGGMASHNSFSSAVVEAGIFAFLGISIFLFSIGKSIWDLRIIERESSKTVFSFTLLFYIQLLMSMSFGDALRLPVTWFWLGMIMAIIRIGKSKYSLDNNKKLDQEVTLTAVSKNA
jgi:hypothetical protein